MILGIGVDTCDIERIRKAIGEPEESTAFLRRVFTEKERAEAPTGRLRAEYFAARFAAKEAVFKAVAHLLPEKTFDFRLVETLRNEDGSPYVVTDGTLAPVFADAGIAKIHISITTEGNFATAFVVAEQSGSAVT